MPRRHRQVTADGPEAVGDDEPRRTIRRRTPLPNGRAVGGGFLVAVAVLGVSGAHLRAGAAPTSAFVVAVHDLAPGTVVERDDLEVRQLVLPSGLAGQAFRRPTEVEGGVLLGPVAAGELLQAGALRTRPSDGADDRRELSVAVDRARAVDGRLQPGDLVDLLATYGTGEHAHTQVVASAALVREVGTGDSSGFGGSGTVTLTVALAAGDDLLAAVHAAHEDAITVVRSTGADELAADDAYQPSGPPLAEPTTSTTRGRGAEDEDTRDEDPGDDESDGAP